MRLSGKSCLYKFVTGKDNKTDMVSGIGELLPIMPRTQIQYDPDEIQKFGINAPSSRVLKQTRPENEHPCHLLHMNKKLGKALFIYLQVLLRKFFDSRWSKRGSVF